MSDNSNKYGSSNSNVTRAIPISLTIAFPVRVPNTNRAEYTPETYSSHQGISNRRVSYRSLGKWCTPREAKQHGVSSGDGTSSGWRARNLGVPGQRQFSSERCIAKLSNFGPGFWLSFLCGEFKGIGAARLPLYSVWHRGLRRLRMGASKPRIPFRKNLKSQWCS